jgi:hypothetical protein
VNNAIVEVHTAEDFDRLSERQKIVVYIKFFRLYLYNRGLPCGAKAIQEKLREETATPVPSTSTIGRVLKQQCLTNGRTGYYEEDYPENTINEEQD